jgi:hypothetical protein
MFWLFFAAYPFTVVVTTLCCLQKEKLRCSYRMERLHTFFPLFLFSSSSGVKTCKPQGSQRESKSSLGVAQGEKKGWN